MIQIARVSAAPCIPIPRCGGRIYRVRRNVPVVRMDRELHLSIGFSSLAMFAPGQRSRGGCFLKRRETPVSVYMRLPQDKTPAAEVRRAGLRHMLSPVFKSVGRGQSRAGSTQG